MMNSDIPKSPRWLERYMPFVARRPEMQVEWLEQALRRGVLSFAEITPYIRLLLENDDDEVKQRVAAALAQLEPELRRQLVVAADIYDTPKLLALLPECTVEQVMAALVKEPPPYEHHPRLVRDRLFYAIYSQARRLFPLAVERLRREGLAPEGFEEAYSRFEELLEDEKLLSALYPRARSKGEIDIKDLEALSSF